MDFHVAPEHPFPSPLEEITHVMEWLKENGESLNLPTQRLILFGDSAGGNLCVSSALKLVERTVHGSPPPVDGIVLIAPSLLSQRHPPSSEKYANDFILPGEVMELVRDFYCNDNNEINHFVSPGYAPRQTSKETPTVLPHVWQQGPSSRRHTQLCTQYIKIGKQSGDSDP